MDVKNLNNLFDMFKIDKKYVDMVCEAKENPKAFLNKYEELRDILIYPSDKLYVGVIEEILEQNQKVFTLDWKATPFDVMKGLECLGIKKEDIIMMDLQSQVNKPLDGALLCIADYLSEYTDLSLILIANDLDDNVVFSIVPNDKLISILDYFKNCEINAFHYNVDYVNDNMINTCELDEEIDYGFDRIYVRKDYKGDIAEILIAEIKYCETGRLKMTNTSSGNQMSSAWISDKLNKMITSQYEDTRNTGNMIINNLNKINTLVMAILPNEKTLEIQDAFHKLNKNNYFRN